jgi:hypothetical protein
VTSRKAILRQPLGIAISRVGKAMMAFDSSISIAVVDDYGTMIRIIRNLPRQLAFAATMLLMAAPRPKKNARQALRPGVISY